MLLKLSQSTRLVLFLSLRSVSATLCPSLGLNCETSVSSTFLPVSSTSLISSSFVASPVVTACATVVPTCASSPIKDPSFELKDGSWTFNGGQIIQATSSHPARTSENLAQFTFVGLGRSNPFYRSKLQNIDGSSNISATLQIEKLGHNVISALISDYVLRNLLTFDPGGDEIISSFSQSLGGLCIDSPYILNGYYSVPLNPGGITCALQVISGNTLLAESDVEMASSGYNQFTANFLPLSASAEVVIALDCTYGSTGAGVFTVDFDDVTLVLENPTPSVSCSAVIPTSTMVAVSPGSSDVSSSSALSTTSTTTLASSVSSTAPLCTSTSGLICGEVAIPRDDNNFLSGEAPAVFDSTLTVTACRDYCLSFPECGGFFFASYGICWPFSGTASDIYLSVAGGADGYQVYDISCFDSCTSSSIPSTATTSSVSSSPITSTLSSSSAFSSQQSESSSTSVYLNSTISTTQASTETTSSSASFLYPNSTISISKSIIKTGIISVGTSISFPNATGSYVRLSGTWSKVTRTTCHKVAKSTSSSIQKTLTLESSTSSHQSTPVSALPESTISTIFSTMVSTVTACPSSVTNCPVGSVVTKTFAISTTVCPVTAKSTPTNFNSKLTTSTIYATSVYTISKCPDTVTNCPIGQIVTKTIAVSTTICPVTEIKNHTPLPPGYTTSTVYATKVETVTKCPVTITNCPVGQVITKTIAVSTTICPIAQAESSGIKGLSSETASNRSTGIDVVPFVSTLLPTATLSAVSSIVLSVATSTSLGSAGSSNWSLVVASVSSTLVAALPTNSLSVAGESTGAEPTPNSLTTGLLPSTSGSSVRGVSSSVTAAPSATIVVGSAEGTSSAKGSLTTSSALEQFTANSADRGTVRWRELGIVLAAAGLAVL